MNLAFNLPYFALLKLRKTFALIHETECNVTWHMGVFCSCKTLYCNPGDPRDISTLKEYQRELLDFGTDREPWTPISCDIRVLWSLLVFVTNRDPWRRSLLEFVTIRDPWSHNLLKFGTHLNVLGSPVTLSRPLYNRTPGKSKPPSPFLLSRPWIAILDSYLKVNVCKNHSRNRNVGT